MAKSKTTKNETETPKAEVKPKAKAKAKAPDMYVSPAGIASARPPIRPGVKFNPRNHLTHDRKPMTDKVAELVERGLLTKAGGK